MGARTGRPRLPREVEYRFWDAVRAGLLVEAAAAAAGVSSMQGKRWFRHRGGVMPAVTAGRRGRSLSFAEREEIAVLRAAGVGVRETARRLGRDPGHDQPGAAAGAAQPERSASTGLPGIDRPE